MWIANHGQLSNDSCARGGARPFPPPHVHGTCNLDRCNLALCSTSFPYSLKRTKFLKKILTWAKFGSPKTPHHPLHHRWGLSPGMWWRRQGVRSGLSKITKRRHRQGGVRRQHPLSMIWVGLQRVKDTTLQYYITQHTFTSYISKKAILEAHSY